MTFQCFNLYKTKNEKKNNKNKKNVEKNSNQFSRLKRRFLVLDIFVNRLGFRLFYLLLLSPNKGDVSHVEFLYGGRIENGLALGEINKFE